MFKVTGVIGNACNVIFCSYFYFFECSFKDYTFFLNTLDTIFQKGTSFIYYLPQLMAIVSSKLTSSRYMTSSLYLSIRADVIQSVETLNAVNGSLANINGYHYSSF